MTVPGNLIKCVIWDLDHTVWSGVLSEGDALALRPGVAASLAELDTRGILLSCSSRNHPDAALAALERFGLRHYFLYPEINWHAKSEAIRRIAASLNIGLDAIAFIDDSPYERAEVAHFLPSVQCFDANDLAVLMNSPRIRNSPVTSEGSSRRLLYQNECQRQEFKKTFGEEEIEFQRQLRIEIEMFTPAESDLARASELTLRTHQLNTSGITYSEAELRDLLNSPSHLVVMVKMTDRFGSHGSVGLAVMEIRDGMASLELLLTSCRVMAYGVGTILLQYLMQRAKRRGLRFRVRFVPTERNKMMYTTYRLSGFRTYEKQRGVEILEHTLENLRAIPGHIGIRERVASLG